MSLQADDLKRIFERPDLAYRAGMAVCTSPERFVEDVLAASRQAVGPAGTQRRRALHFYVILGGSLAERLPLRSIQDGARVVSAFLRPEGDFTYNVLMDEHIDGALILVIASVPEKVHPEGEWRSPRKPLN